MKKSTLALALTLVSTSFLYSCAKGSAAEDLKDAQMCLNTSPASEARNCVAKIASDTSADASKLRCAAVFISEGFGNPSSFISALDQLNGSGSCTGGCSPTVNAATTLNFKSAGVGSAQNNVTATEAFDECTKSGIKIYSEIAAIFKIGTLASVVAAVPNPTPDQIKAAIGSLPEADLGNIAISAHQTSCGNLDNASESTVKFCTELGAALESGSGSAFDVGTCFKAKLQDPNAACAP